MPPDHQGRKGDDSAVAGELFLKTPAMPRVPKMGFEVLMVPSLGYLEP